MVMKGADVSIPDKSLFEIILKSCSELGDKEALVNHCRDGLSITYKEIANQSRCCAAFLHKHGVRKGDIVGLCSPSGTEYAVALLGILTCGATVNPCSPVFKEGELCQLFNNVKPKAVFAFEGAHETINRLRKDSPFIQSVFIIGPSSAKSGSEVTWNEIVSFQGSTDFIENIKINPAEDIALLPCSSGTTGLPKAVMLSHRNLIVASTALASCFTPCDGMCVYTDRSMYHMFGILTLLFCLNHGRKLIIGKEYALASLLEGVEKYKATHVTTVPPLLIRISNGEMMEKHDIKSLKQALCGGDTVPPNVIETLTQKYNIGVSHLYGISEAGVPTVNLNTRENSASVGQPTLRTEVKIIDLVTSEESETDQKGEILIRGDQVMKGYLNNTEGTKKVMFGDGWMRTGDIGRIDKNGELYVIGRLKDIIMYRARQVNPSEVENVISKHPKVADVGVVGIPHPINGEVTKAFIVKGDPSLTEEEIHELVKQELADYKQLIGGAQFVDAIPKSPTGKIMRRKLREMST